MTVIKCFCFTRVTLQDIRCRPYCPYTNWCFYRSACTCINGIITLQLVIEDYLVLFYSQRAFHPLEANQRFFRVYAHLTREHPILFADSFQMTFSVNLFAIIHSGII